MVRADNTGGDNGQGIGYGDGPIGAARPPEDPLDARPMPDEPTTPDQDANARCIHTDRAADIPAANSDRNTQRNHNSGQNICMDATIQTCDHELIHSCTHSFATEIRTLSPITTRDKLRT